MLGPCRSQITNQKAPSRLECAVEHPMKDASPACPEPRRRERASRPKDLSANVRALECAVEHLAKDASPERASRPKDLSAALTSLECAVPRFAVLTPLECAVAKTRPRKSFRMRSYEKRWGGGVHTRFYPVTFSPVPGHEPPLTSYCVSVEGPCGNHRHTANKGRPTSDLFTEHGSRVTTRSSYCASFRSVPQLARIAQVPGNKAASFGV